jgi:hypothetical protein
MADPPAPLILMAGADPTEAAFGSYAAAVAGGRHLLAAETSQRLGRLGAAVVPIQRYPQDTAFRWGPWFVEAARSTLAGATEVNALGWVGSGALPLLADHDLGDLLTPIPGETVANNRFSADAFVVAGDVGAALDALESVATDNTAVHALEAAGFTPRDLADRPWSRFDVDTPLDLALLRLALRLPATRQPDRAVSAYLEGVQLPTGSGLVIPGLERVLGVLRDRERQLVVAGRMPASAWQYLERQAACRVRGFVEERGMRAAPDGVPRSLLARWIDRLGPADLIGELAELGDAVVLDTRVLMAALAGSSRSERWPAAEERFASDFLDARRIETHWLRELTEAAAAAPVPFILGGHALVSDGLRILTDVAWLGH